MPVHDIWALLPIWLFADASESNYRKGAQKSHAATIYDENKAISIAALRAH
jgi:hypothetical protein